MLASLPPVTPDPTEQDVWRALANPLRRQLLDELRSRPMTTGELADSIPDHSRFAVMQHLGVLVESDLVVVRRRGRHRYNHLNPVPLRRWYERWVAPLADQAASEMLALERHTEHQTAHEGGAPMAIATDQIRTARVETELRFRTTPERLFRALTEETLAWFPHTYGEERTKAVILEPRVGGANYEDWGNGMGHLYGHVTLFDKPNAFATRSRLMPGVILDSEYTLEADGDETVLRVSKVAVGPMTDDEAASISTYGDLARFQDPLRALVEGS
jgi:DNA-binding transcriptional ArsR family regulator